MRRRGGSWRATSGRAVSSTACASPMSRRIWRPATLRSTCRAWASWCSTSATAGNFYAILAPQKNFGGLETMSAGDVLRLSPIVRRLLNDKIQPVHPENPTIKDVSHVMWTGKARDPRAHARNAVFYGDKAIDRSPCGTGTSARMAQWFAKGKLALGESFIHESIIGSTFTGKIEGLAEVGGRRAIIPSIEGWAKIYGYNTISVDAAD